MKRIEKVFIVSILFIVALVVGISVSHRNCDKVETFPVVRDNEVVNGISIGIEIYDLDTRTVGSLTTLIINQASSILIEDGDFVISDKTRALYKTVCHGGAELLDDIINESCSNHDINVRYTALDILSSNAWMSYCRDRTLHTLETLVEEPTNCYPLSVISGTYSNDFDVT